MSRRRQRRRAARLERCFAPRHARRFGVAGRCTGEVRAGARAEAGDTVEVELRLDSEDRTVEVPPVLAQALAGDPEAKARYDALSSTHRKEHARWIDEAKREETRERRVAQALEMLKAGRTRSWPMSPGGPGRHSRPAEPAALLLDPERHRGR